jgi:protein-arginine kinase activator protein McsA
MPFFIRISQCYKGHELTVHAEPINKDEISLTWVCEECAAARTAAEKSEAPELRENEAVGGGGDEPGDVVRAQS